MFSFCIIHDWFLWRRAGILWRKSDIMLVPCDVIVILGTSEIASVNYYKTALIR